MSNNSDRELRQRPRLDYRVLNTVGREGASAEPVDPANSSDSELFFSGCDSPGRSSSNSCQELDTTAVAVTESNCAESVKLAEDGKS